MSSFGVVEIQAVFAVLHDCAPGHSVKTTDHGHRIMWRDKTYPGFPLGAHGKKRKRKAEIKLGHMRQLIRVLGIDPDCAKRHIPQLD